MNNTKTVTVRLMHKSSIPNTRWCEPVRWEPANEIDGSEFEDGCWWDESEQTAGLVFFCNPDEYGSQDVVDVEIDNLRVASCGEVRVIGKVEL